MYALRVIPQFRYSQAAVVLLITLQVLKTEHHINQAPSAIDHVDEPRINFLRPTLSPLPTPLRLRPDLTRPPAQFRTDQNGPPLTYLSGILV